MKRKEYIRTAYQEMCDILKGEKYTARDRYAVIKNKVKEYVKQDRDVLTELKIETNRDTIYGDTAVVLAVIPILFAVISCFMEKIVDLIADVMASSIGMAKPDAGLQLAIIIGVIAIITLMTIALLKPMIDELLDYEEFGRYIRNALEEMEKDLNKEEDDSENIDIKTTNNKEINEFAINIKQGKECDKYE